MTIRWIAATLRKLPRLAASKERKLIGRLPFLCPQPVILNAGATRVLVAVPGVDMVDHEIEIMGTNLTSNVPAFGGEQSYVVWTYTSEFFHIGDFVQIFSHELLLAIDITAVWAAEQIAVAARALEARHPDGQWTIDVVAHSQGSMVFARALEYLPEYIRGRIKYIGVEPQQDVAGNGLMTADNIHDSGDPVPFANFLPNRLFNLPFYLMGGQITPSAEVHPPGMLNSHHYFYHYADIQAVAESAGE